MSQHVEPVEIGQRDVEEHQVGRQLLDRSDRVGAARTLTDDREIRLLAEDCAKPRAGERLVVHYQDANACHETPPSLVELLAVFAST